jgi:hypothetical protein
VADRLPDLLLDLLKRRRGGQGGGWFDAVARIRESSFNRDSFAESFAAAARHLGRGPLDLTAEEGAGLQEMGVDWTLGGWGLDEMGRATLLLLAARLGADEFEPLLESCYRRGENRERQAVLRSLPLLPAADRFLYVGVDACRSHVQPIFEAIACENPYPATHFPELNFNQMVLKALFINVSLERIVNLPRRVTSDLARMARAYESERRAAGRGVPDDIRLVTAG